MAEQQGVDLVEISPNANPPVCKLIDYSKFLYQLKKKAKEQKEMFRRDAQAADMVYSEQIQAESASAVENIISDEAEAVEIVEE